jgi:threonine/homoserine/homoserine lactone efflux protein
MRAHRLVRSGVMMLGLGLLMLAVAASLGLAATPALRGILTLVGAAALLVGAWTLLIARGERLR